MRRDCTAGKLGECDEANDEEMGANDEETRSINVTGVAQLQPELPELPLQTQKWVVPLEFPSVPKSLCDFL